MHVKSQLYQKEDTTMSQLDSSSLSATQIKKEVFQLRGYNFFVYMTQALVVSFLPLYFLDLGFNASQIGFLYSIGPIISIFANIIMGFLSDKKQTIVKIVRILYAIQFIAIGLLHQFDTFSIVCLVMTLFYFCYTTITPLNDSLIMLSSRSTKKPYALIRLFGSSGFALSAYLFGVILKQIGTSHTVNLMLITLFISFIFTFVLKDYHEQKNASINVKELWTLLKQRHVVLFFLFLFLISTSHRMYEGFLAITLRGLGASDSLIGLAWLVSATSEIPILFLLGKYGHKFKELPLIIFASIMYALRMYFISVIENPTLVIFTQLMHSVTFGIYFSTVIRYLQFLLPDKYRSSGQAIYTIVWMGFSGTISGLVGGNVYAQFGHVMFYQLATGFAVAGTVGFIYYAIKYRH